jgi:MFS family permease
MALAPVFPLLPWFWPLLLLQVVNGGALQFAWSGSQTLIAQLAEGEAEYLGRFSFFARIGTTVAPMIAGAAWDFGGAWPAYALGFAWGVALTLALLRAPEAPIATGDGRNPGRRVRLRVVDVLPRLPDYVRCFALMSIPAVATTMAIIFLRKVTFHRLLDTTPQDFLMLPHARTSKWTKGLGAIAELDGVRGWRRTPRQ